MELDGIFGVDFGIYEDDVVDEKGDEEVKEFIEEVFVWLEFEYCVGEEIGIDGSGVMVVVEDYLDWKELFGILLFIIFSNIVENDDVVVIKLFLYFFDIKIFVFVFESVG